MEFPEEGGVILQADRNLTVALTPMLLEQAEKPLVKRFPIFVPSLQIVEQGQVIQAGQDLFVTIWVVLLHELERLLIERLGPRVMSIVVVEVTDLLQDQSVELGLRSGFLAYLNHSQKLPFRIFIAAMDV
jgi:hypothetical protein